MPSNIIARIPLIYKHLKYRAQFFLEWDMWQTRSWGQEGEDLILKSIYHQKTDGFYVDIGAHHPKRYSNTFLFYKRGWRGINVDATPGSMSLFQKQRPRDINVEVGIGSESSEMEYYLFNEPALNGFSKEISEIRENEDNEFKLIEVRKVKVYPLTELFDKYLPKGQMIDFLSIDVEGLDLDVLMSNNWDIYKPGVILIELLGKTAEGALDSELNRYIRSKGYSLYAKTVNTLFYKLI